MTVEEWMAADDRAIYHSVSLLDSRRQRLLAAAVCRAMGQWVDYPAVHAAFDTVEKFADTNKTKAALHRARQAIQALRVELSRAQADGRIGLALFAIQLAASENAVAGTTGQAIESLRLAEGVSAEVIRRRLYATYADITGISSGSAAFDPAWRTSTAFALARQMYESRDFSAMPILADALMDAGCDSDDILDHCRGDGPHVRGCWVVDLVLGKA